MLPVYISWPAVLGCSNGFAVISKVPIAAALGYTNPVYYKFPGFLLPSLGLRFSDVPDGFTVLSKVPYRSSLGLHHPGVLRASRSLVSIA